MKTVTKNGLEVSRLLVAIHTMNTADRSLALMDTALRRRFDFIEMMPDYDTLKDSNGKAYSVSGIDLVKLLNKLNERIAALYDREHMLGHAFLMPVVTEIKAGNQQKAMSELALCFKTKIIPLLAEYFFENWEKIRLVLADNQKDTEEQLIKEDIVDFSDLFGDTTKINSLDNEATTYTLINYGNDLWYNPMTYKSMYTEVKSNEASS